MQWIISVNVKAAVFENIKHAHAYARSNAIMCILNFIDKILKECQINEMINENKILTPTQKEILWIMKKINFFKKIAKKFYKN